MTSLFTLATAGRLHLLNRIVMATMTRARDDDAGRPSAIAATYCQQRAGTALIISEGLFPEPIGKSYVGTPGC